MIILTSPPSVKSVLGGAQDALEAGLVSLSLVAGTQSSGT